MLAEALTALALRAGNTVVAAATTDAWEAARRRFARLLGRGGPLQEQLAVERLEEMHEQLAGAAGADLEQTRAAQVQRWTSRLADLLEVDPGIEAELRALVEQIRAALPTGRVSAADHSYTAGRDMNISASDGGTAAGVIHGDVALPDTPWRRRGIGRSPTREEADRRAKGAPVGPLPGGRNRGLPGSDEPDRRDDSPPVFERAAEQPVRRVFAAEFEDHPLSQPLKLDEQYTIAFSVGPSSVNAFAAESPWPEDLLAKAYGDSEVLELAVQLDSDDFEIFSDAVQRLRVPRTGRSRGKARFDIAPRRNGRCELVASVDYKGNFVHQMKVTITVGGAGQAAVKVSARGRPPDSAVVLEPRDISITLEPAAPRGFLCTTMGSVRGRTHLPISATELALAVERAREAMMAVIGWPSVGEHVFQTRIDIPAEAQDMALRTLARAGARLFQRLFLHPQADADARKAGEWLRENAMDPGSRLKVLIAADDAPLPWAMLYLGDASDGAALDWDYFLGMRHVVEQLPLQPSMSTWDSKIPSTPKLAVSVNVNRSIDNPAKGITLAAGHQRHWTDVAAARAGLTLIPRTTKTEVVRALADASTADQVVYFYCHATASAPDSQDPDTAEIIMGKNDRAMLADLNLDAPTSVQLAGNPLVFINACESAGLSPLFYNGFVPYFMAKGARGVIGTECKTPALFAVEWANAFFDRFLDGAPIGETVLQLRQQFLREHGNPLGLVYAVHCAANTRIVPALTHAKAG